MTYAAPPLRRGRSRGLGLLPGETLVVPPEPTSGTMRTGTVVTSPYPPAPTGPLTPPPGGIVTTPPTVYRPPVKPPTISPPAIPKPTEQGGQVQTHAASPAKTAGSSSSGPSLPAWWPLAAGAAVLLLLVRGR